MFASLLSSLLPAGFDIMRFSTNLGIKSPVIVGGFIILIGCVIIAQGAWDCHKGFSGQGGSGKFLGLGFAAVIVGAIFAIKGSILALRNFGNGTANSIEEMGQGLVTNYFPTMTALPFHSLIHIL